MKSRKSLAIVILLISVLMVSCATTSPPMSTKGKAAMVLATYNTQTQQTAIMSQRPDLTEAQKVMVRRKKAIILKLDPMIKAYGIVIQQGGTPSTADEQAIYSMIDELVGGE